MSSDRWREVSRLYHAAIAQPADARVAFLADACPDETLRQEVQALLAQPLSTPGFLEPGAFGAAVRALSGAPPLTGSIGPYEIQGLLGAGGMGEVYRARDPRLGRDVAIKILPREFTNDADRLARFEREARILAALNHPHIAAIYGLEDGPGDDGRSRALILELVEGETLDDRLVRGPLTLHDALTVATQVAGALQVAHEKGIVHRDLKPANIKITPNGVVKVLDFGLAKITSDHLPGQDTTGPTRDGLIVGTVAYMSPEQTRGQDVDTRSDIWAFGCVLYEMLTGKRAFEGNTLTDVMAAVVTNEPDWHALPPETPPTIRSNLRRCLQKNVSRRRQHIGDVGIEIQEALAEPASSPSTLSERESSVTTSRRPRFELPVAIAIAAAGLLGGLGIVWYQSQLEAPGDTPRFIPVTFRAGTLTAARFTPDGDSIVYSAAWGVDPHALFMTRRDSVESKRLDVPNARLLGVSSTGELAFLRGPQFALKLLAPGSGTLLRVSMTGGGPRPLLDDVIAADWKPGGSDLAVVRRGQVEFPLGTRIHGQHRFRHVRVAPDGQRLALVEGSGRDADGKQVAAAIVLLDLSGRKTTLSSGWDNFASLAWSPSGDEVWFTANRPGDFLGSDIRAVSTDGRERVIFSSPSSFLLIQDVLPNGRVLLSSHASRTGCSCLASGETQPRDVGWLDGPGPEALSADGRMVLMAEQLRARGPAGSIYLRGTDGSDAVRLGDGFPEDLSPDGKWVLATPVGTRSHWFLLPTGTGSPRTLPPGPLVQRYEANFLPPDGRRIVFGGREKDRGPRIFVQDVDSGSVRPISPENTGSQLVTSPDGRFVIGATGAKRFLFPVDGSEPVPFSIMAPDDTALQWGSDERSLYVRRGGATWPPVVDRIEIATGRREAWKTIQPADPVGVDNIARILVTPDGKAYCHDYVRFLSELFVVEGLR